METKPKPGRYVTKGERSLSEKKPFATVNVPAASFAESVRSVESVTPALSEAQTQIANRIFRQRVEKIADAKVTVRAGENEWEPIYRVEVPELRSAAFDKTVKLRSRLYRKYPEAIINIEFRGRRELNEAENNPRFANL